jgi:hypothetical protein
MGRDPRTSVLNGWNQVHASITIPSPRAYDGRVPIDQVGRRNWTA